MNNATPPLYSIRNFHLPCWTPAGNRPLHKDSVPRRRYKDLRSAGRTNIARDSAGRAPIFPGDSLKKVQRDLWPALRKVKHPIQHRSSVFSQQRAVIMSVIEWIACRAAVTHPDIKEPVRPKGQLTAIMMAKGCGITKRISSLK